MTSPDREIIFFQVGPVSNRLAHHFWTMASHLHSDFENPQIMSELSSFPFGSPLNSSETSRRFQPRSISIDFDDYSYMQNSVPNSAISSSSSSSSSINDISSLWKAPMSSINNTNKIPISSPQISSQYYSLQDRYSPNQLHCDNPFDQYDHGLSLCTNEAVDDILDEKLRQILEQSHQPQGIVFFSDINSAWGGFSSRFLPHLRDYLSKSTILSIGSIGPVDSSPPSDGDESSSSSTKTKSTSSAVDESKSFSRPDLVWEKQVINTSMAIHGIETLSDTFIPLSFSGFSLYSLLMKETCGFPSPPFESYFHHNQHWIHDFSTSKVAMETTSSALYSIFMPLCSQRKRIYLYDITRRFTAVSSTISIPSLGIASPFPVTHLATPLGQQYTYGPRSAQHIHPQSIPFVLGLLGPSINLARWGSWNFEKNATLNYNSPQIATNANFLGSYLFQQVPLNKLSANSSNAMIAIQKRNPSVFSLFQGFNRPVITSSSQPIETKPLTLSDLSPQQRRMFNSLSILVGPQKALETVASMNQPAASPMESPQRVSNRKPLYSSFDPSPFISCTPGTRFGFASLEDSVAKDCLNLSSSTHTQEDLIRTAKVVPHLARNFSEIVSFTGFPLNAPLPKGWASSPGFKTINPEIRDARTVGDVFSSFMKASNPLLTSTHFSFFSTPKVSSNHLKLKLGITEHGTLDNPLHQPQSTSSNSPKFHHFPSITQLAETKQIARFFRPLNQEFSTIHSQNSTIKKFYHTGRLNLDDVIDAKTRLVDIIDQYSS